MIKIPIDPTNPGHVFAAVGLTELAYRLTGEAKGYFDNLNYILLTDDDMTIGELVSRIKKLSLIAKNPRDVNTALSLDGLLLDWWLRDSAKNNEAGNLKTWAGKMNVSVIASATQHCLSDKESLLFERSLTINSEQKEGPALTSFDAQRSRSTLDTGYSPDKLEHDIVPSPSVEFLALIGLQRALPTKVREKPTKEHQRSTCYHAYFTWSSPLPSLLLPAAVAGLISPHSGYKFSSIMDGKVYRFQSAQLFHQNNKQQP